LKDGKNRVIIHKMLYRAAMLPVKKQTISGGVVRLVKTGVSV